MRDIYNHMENKIKYSCVLLDEKSSTLIYQYFGHLMPNKGWKWIGHHMTITLGPLPEDMKNDLGKSVGLAVIGIGQDNNAIALKVEGVFSKNEIPHITLAINQAQGARPVMSNKIPVKNWKNIDFPYRLTGTIEEIK